MTRPTALIAEDEPLMRERLKEKLAEAWPELDVVAAGRGRRRGAGALRTESARYRVPRHPHARAGPASSRGRRSARDCHVVFITAYDQYALQGVRRRRGRLPAEAGGARPAGRRRSSASSKKLHSPPGGPLRAARGAARGGRGGEAPRMKWIKAAVGKQMKLIAVDDVALFPVRHQVHARRARQRRGADPHAAEGTAGRARSGQVLAGAPRHDRQPRRRFGRPARGRRAPVRPAQAPAGELPISRQFTHLFKQM